MERISFEVSEEQFETLLDMKGRKTWRELFLKALGFETQRQKPGPRDRQE